MNLHFLLVGAIFFWPIVGVDPAPRRLMPAARMGLVFASVPFHAFFGLAVMSANTLLGGEYYRSLALPWVPDPLLDQHLAGGMAWAAGEVPLLLVVIALLIQWSRQDERSARRDDRRADADGDAELTAYNAMLRRLATAGPPLVAQSDQNHYDPSHTEDAFRSGSTGSGVRRPASDTLIAPGQGHNEGTEEAPAMGKNAQPLVEREDRDQHGE
jgi:hypothetical protein